MKVRIPVTYSAEETGSNWDRYTAVWDVSSVLFLDLGRGYIVLPWDKSVSYMFCCVFFLCLCYNSHIIVSKVKKIIKGKQNG